MQNGGVITLEELREALGDCRRCGLHGGRNNLVFGAGAENARLMFVGEAPGRVEDERGLPFVGPAGRLLDRLLDGIGMSREDVFITNVVKCRPPGNRDPLPEESRACDPLLKKQIEIIRPELVCALGRIAAGILLQRNVQITRMNGTRFPGDGYYIVPVFHPAAALRGASAMEAIEGDFQQLKAYLEEKAEAKAPAAEKAEPEQMGLF